MFEKRVMVALGGNALGDTPEEQKEAVKKAAHQAKTQFRP